MLDTLKYAKQLREAGLTEQQAEVHARALWEAIQESVATKEDLFATRQELKNDIETLRQELHTEVGALRQELHAELGKLRQELKGDIAALTERFEGRFRMLYWMQGVIIALLVAVLAGMLAG